MCKQSKQILGIYRGAEIAESDREVFKYIQPPIREMEGYKDGWYKSFTERCAVLGGTCGKKWSTMLQNLRGRLRWLG